MAALPSHLSPCKLSPTHEDAQQALPPCFLRCSSYPSRGAPAPHYAPPKPSALLERRVHMNPTLTVSSFQTSLGPAVGTSANRREATKAFQAGVGTSPRAPPSNRQQPATLYDVLEVPRTATENEIKTAYRRLAREHHPDRAPPQEKDASTTKFLRIHSAYAALSDPQSRAQYDLQLSLPSFRSPGYPDRSPKFSSSTYCSPRTPYSSGRGRSWETDQCWC